MRQIDHQSGTLKYLQLAAILREAIASGELAPDRPIPSGPQLAAEYGISQGTARRAVQALVDEGLVAIVTGRGTFVTTGDAA